MPPVLVLVGVATGAFVSTNVDAFLLLVANVARAPRSQRSASGGFLLATVLVLAGAWVVAAASKVIPPAHAGLIGLLPLGMGIKQAVDLVRARTSAGVKRASVDPAIVPAEGTVRLGAALLLHLAFSADNLAVYTALLTDTLPHLRPAVVATMLVLALVWAALARSAIRVPGLSRVLMRWGNGLMAVLLVVVGVYILVDTETDVLPPAAAEAAPRGAAG
jgi:cadmium resistance protein CadD (predicted permease)